MLTPTIDIRLGNTIDLIRDIPLASVDLIMTSPPWPTRHNGPHADEYVAWFIPYGREFLRVLKPTGSLALHIKEPVIDGHRHTCLLSLILALQAMGFDWHDEYICVKSTQFPRQTRRRLRDGFDQSLHVTVGGQFAFDDRQLSVPVAEHAQRQRNRSTRANWESPTGAGFHLVLDGWEPSTHIVPTNVLRLKSEGRNLGHPCPYRERIPEFFIRLLTKPKDVVL